MVTAVASEAAAEDGTVAATVGLDDEDDSGGIEIGTCGYGAVENNNAVRAVAAVPEPSRRATRCNERCSDSESAVMVGGQPAKQRGRKLSKGPVENTSAISLATSDEGQESSRERRNAPQGNPSRERRITLQKD